MRDADQNWEEKTEAILGRAFTNGRSILYEHEIYEILTILGIKVPVHRLIQNPEEISVAMLRKFGSNRVVVKIVSRAITHKLESDGVRIVYKDLEFVKHTCRQMLDHFNKSHTAVDGILLVEFIEHSKSLGNEILLGFNETGDFGPVISFSKGGSDAVHFAENFSSPNLILPPLDKEWATALQKSTKIYSKFVGRDISAHISRIVDAEIKFSRLAVQFSNFFTTSSKFAITEFEVNPLVFTPDQDFYALDGLASFTLKKTGTSTPPPAAALSLDNFFKPRGIAVFGVSESNSRKSANVILNNLVHLGHNHVAGISLKGNSTMVNGRPYPLHTSLESVPHIVDLAVVCVPAEATPAVVEACGRKGVKSIILIPGGFSEVTGNRNIEAQIMAHVNTYGMRIIGPNCLGIIYDDNGAHNSINTFFISQDKFRVNLTKKKNVVIISQSGAAGITTIHNLRHAISPRAIISYGNQIDVDASELIDYFSGDQAVEVLGLYIEGFKPGAGRRFFSAVAACNKPVVVYKAGRTPAGRKAAESHTASIAGEYAVTMAAVKQAGGIIAENITDLHDFIKTFALLGTCTVSGDRIAVIANAGYEKTYAADRLGNLKPAVLSPLTTGTLKRFLPAYIEIDSFLDLTPIVTDEQFAQSIETMLAADEVDALCVSIVPQAELLHTTGHEIDMCTTNIAARIIDLAGHHKKPVVVSVNVLPGSDGIYNRFCEMLDDGGVPVFLTAGSAMASLNAFIRYHKIKENRLLSEWLK